MVAEVVAHVHLLEFAVVGQLVVHVLVELVEVALHVLLVHLAHTGHLQCEALVHVGDHDGLAEHGLVVQA